MHVSTRFSIFRRVVPSFMITTKLVNLHWLEALNWIRKTSEGILAILSLEVLIPVNLSDNIQMNSNQSILKPIKLLICTCLFMM